MDKNENELWAVVGEDLIESDILSLWENEHEAELECERLLGVTENWCKIKVLALV